MSWEPGTHVQAFGAKSLHAGQSGVVVRDDGEYIMLLADDPSYKQAHKNSIDEPDSPNRYFWVSNLCLKQLKD